MYAPNSNWDLVVLNGQGNVLGPQYRDFGFEKAPRQQLPASCRWHPYGRNVQNIPRNMALQPLQQQPWLPSLSGEAFDTMNAPFLTGGQSPSHPGLINEINTDVSVLTPPSSIIVPSSIESSPQGLSIKPDPVSQTCLVQGAQMLQPQQQQPGSFPILRCVSCGNMDCMVPAEPNEDLPYGLHYRVGGHIPSPQHQHEQWPQTQPWGFNASETLPDQASMHFEAASAFPNLDVQQHGGLVKDFGFGSEPFPLASSGVSLTLPVSLAPGTPESVGMLHQQQPHMQEQTQVEAEVQAAQRKRLPEIPDQPQLSEYTSEDSEMASEDDSDHESDISSFDESYDDQTVHISNTKTNQRLGDVAAGSFSPLSSATDTATRNPITAAGTQIALDAPSNKEGRRAKDDFLLKCRARGMTYREIKEAGNLQEAESTLRGRHRVLTKNKSERIRKPSWTQDDIKLLRTTVKSRTWRKKKGKKTYIRWSKVASDMAEAGCSYPFGAMTCSNKWSELIYNNSFRQLGAEE